MDYEIINDITRSDIAIRVKGKSPEETFIKAGKALISELIADISLIQPVTKITGELRTTNIEMLYFEFLNEIIFYKDSKNLLLIPDALNITYDSGTYLCTYSLSGEKINREKHQFKVDIKAVTLHGLKLLREGDTYIAESVFDV